MIKLDLNFEGDETLKNNIRQVDEAFKGSPIMNGKWKAFDKELAVGTHIIYHKLGFIPRDVIQTFLTSGGAGTVTYNFDSFTDQTMSVTVGTASVRVRFLVGKAG
jgi:hypothetical protein